MDTSILAATLYGLGSAVFGVISYKRFKANNSRGYLFAGIALIGAAHAGELVLNKRAEPAPAISAPAPK